MKVTFCKTKAGNGFKIIVDNKWHYTVKEKLFEADIPIPNSYLTKLTAC